MGRSHFLSVALLLVMFPACGSSGGGGGSAVPDIPASVPPGAGVLQIDMAGTWAIQDTSVLETNAANPTSPPNGTLFMLEPTRIASIGGLSVEQSALEQFVNAPLESYVNQLDGTNVYYAVVTDQRASGGERIETALAGGAVDANTILVEAFTSAQGASDPAPQFTRSRYTLVRVPGTTPLQHRPESWTAEDLLRAAFGDV